MGVIGFGVHRVGVPHDGNDDDDTYMIPQGRRPGFAALGQKTRALISVEAGSMPVSLACHAIKAQVTCRF